LLKSQLPRETAVETAGELLEAVTQKATVISSRASQKARHQTIQWVWVPNAKNEEGSETMHLLPKAKAKAKI
jgi:hypothetical protein